MPQNNIATIGIVAPKEHRHVLGLTHIRQSFVRSFPKAKLVNLEEGDLVSLNRLKACDLIILPPSFYGEDTPYKHYLQGRAARNLSAYAQEGRLATFCSGTWAILKNFSYVFNNGQRQHYEGYVPLVPLDAQGPKDGSSAFRIVPVFNRAAQETVNLCYDGGPVMSARAMTPDMRALAWFDDDEISILAKKQSGGGMIAAFSSLADIMAVDVPDQGAYATVRASLKETEEGHTKLWQTAMGILEHRDLHFAPHI